MKKRIHVRVEHAVPSRCREEFLARRVANDALKAEAKKAGSEEGGMGWIRVENGSDSRLVGVSNNKLLQEISFIKPLFTLSQSPSPRRSACLLPLALVSCWRTSRWRPSLPSPTISSRRVCNKCGHGKEQGSEVGAGLFPPW